MSIKIFKISEIVVLKNKISKKINFYIIKVELFLAQSSLFRRTRVETCIFRDKLIPSIFVLVKNVKKNITNHRISTKRE